MKNKSSVRTFLLGLVVVVAGGFGIAQAVTPAPVSAGYCSNQGVCGRVCGPAGGIWQHWQGCLCCVDS